jgi:hypothetical protein
LIEKVKGEEISKESLLSELNDRTRHYAQMESETALKVLLIF